MLGVSVYTPGFPVTVIVLPVSPVRSAILVYTSSKAVEDRLASSSEKFTLIPVAFTCASLKLLPKVLVRFVAALKSMEGI